MILTWFAAASVLVPPPNGRPQGAPERARTGEHGKIAWFSGSFDEALAEAKANQKLVFVDFWTESCGWCKRLDRETYSDDAVFSGMKDLVCLNLDAQSRAGKPVALRYQVRLYPTLIFLASDGSLEERIEGYLPPASFKKEVERIRAGKGTLGELRRQVEGDRTDPDKRYRLGRRLADLGDAAGRDAQVAEIRRLDPAGSSLAMHHLAFEELVAKISAGWQKSQSLDTASMEAFVGKETYPEVLFEARRSLGQMYKYLGDQDERAGDTAAARRHRADARNAMKAAWSSVPEDQVVEYGNTVAWYFYESREDLAPADKTFALEVAERFAPGAQDDVNALDTYACALFLNGKKEQALQQIARCIELDPKNGDWKDRRAQFLK